MRARVMWAARRRPACVLLHQCCSLVACCGVCCRPPMCCLAHPPSHPLNPTLLPPPDCSVSVYPQVADVAWNSQWQATSAGDVISGVWNGSLVTVQVRCQWGAGRAQQRKERQAELSRSALLLGTAAAAGSDTAAAAAMPDEPAGTAPPRIAGPGQRRASVCA